MKSTLIKKLLAVVLIACSTVVYGSPNLEGAKTADYIYRQSESIRLNTSRRDLLSTIRKNVNFNDVKYTHIDAEDFYNIVKQIEGLIENPKNNYLIISNFMDLIDLTDEMGNQYQIARLYNSLDVTDTYYITEVNYCYNNMIVFQDEIAKVAKKIIASPSKESVEAIWGESVTAYYENYEVYSKEQNELLNKEQELLLKYNEVSNEAFTTTLNGKTYNISDLAVDNKLLDEEYKAAYKRILKAQNEALGSIYVELVKVRQQLANLYGYNHYADYCYDILYGRDYTPQDTLKINKEVKKQIVPLYKALMEDYNKDAAEDLNIYIAGISPDAQFSMIQKYLSQVSPDLVSSFEYMMRNNLYSINYTKNKLDMGYTTFLDKYEIPFLYNKPGFSFYDFTSLVHEFGHFNAYYVNVEEASSYENIDLSEIHSQGLEFLYTHFYEDMLGEERGKAAIEYVVLDKLDSIIQGCLYDEFQQKVYTLENPTLEQINNIFSELQKEYGITDSLSDGHWALVIHNYQQPLYYISYTMSALPSFEIWMRSLKDFDGACSTYMDLVDYGESGTYKGTLKACGLANPFNEDYFEELAATLKTYYHLK